MKFVLNDGKVRAACVEHILNIDVSAKPIMNVSITPFKKDRSTQQNRYYWKVVIGMFSDATGYTPVEIHETCKLQLLPTKIVQIGGVTKEIATSTASLSTVEFEEYVENIKQFVAENLGVYIPDCNEFNV